MKNGYYSSTYFFINDLAHVTGMKLRHDMNMSLWKYWDGNISLVKYWELERVTGLKQHYAAFYDKEHAISVINTLLSEFELSIADMEEVWGTPQLHTEKGYCSMDDYPGYAYHSLCHMFGAMLSDTDIFYREDILTIAVDGAPDNVLDDIDNKYLYS